MYDIDVYAVRKDDVISVTVTGSLSDSCYEAKIIDKYPGGSIVYIDDPGSAQVMIQETKMPGSEICLMYLVPWVGHVKIHDRKHDKVTVFINGDPVATVPVKNAPDKYRVIALSAGSGDIKTGCSVIPYDAYYLSIYTEVYGPASKEECEKWVAENCSKVSDR